MSIMSISFPGGGGVVSISYPGSKPGNGVDGGVEVEVSMTISISPTQDVLSRLTEVSCWDWIPDGPAMAGSSGVISTTASSPPVQSSTISTWALAQWYASLPKTNRFLVLGQGYQCEPLVTSGCFFLQCLARLSIFEYLPSNSGMMQAKIPFGLGSGASGVRGRSHPWPKNWATSMGMLSSPG